MRRKKQPAAPDPALPDAAPASRRGACRRGLRLLAAACVLALLGAGVWTVFFRAGDARTVVADFTYIQGVHVGSDVDVLGVPLGRVESLDPRGDRVRVTMSLRGDVRLPADVEAYVMNPSVISARFIELGPAYTSADGGEAGGDGAGGDGAEYRDGQVIPVSRTHAPINWDDLLFSVDTIASALGPGGGDVGAALTRAAETTDGTGPALHRAIENIGAATSIVGARTEDIGRLIEDLDTIADAFGAREGRVADLVEATALLGDEIAQQNLDIATPLEDLRDVFDRLDELLTSRSDELAEVITDARTVTGRLAAHPVDLAEFADLEPLAMQNIAAAIGDDGRARLRLDVSTNGAQFAATEELCRRYPSPLCMGAGVTNPVPIPLQIPEIPGSAAGRLPIARALRTGLLPTGAAEGNAGGANGADAEEGEGP